MKSIDMPTDRAKIMKQHDRPFGNTGLAVPPIMFGTRALGADAEPIPEQTRRAIIGEWFERVEPPVFINTRCDGVALQMLGHTLKRFDVSPEEIVINLELDVPTMHYDATCNRWHEAVERLGGRYTPRLASLRGLDAYLAAATTAADRDRRFANVLEAYRALNDLKSAAQIAAIGASATDWRIVLQILTIVDLDWVMLAGCLTVLNHSTDVIDFVASLAECQIPFVNSGVFQSGFLVGGPHFDERIISTEAASDRPLFAWRKAFVALCHGHGISPAHACIQFGLSPPGVVAVALNTSHPDRVAENVASVLNQVPNSFWAAMKEEGLLAAEYPHLG
jgi:D-threo-aldose 1-dehydrogenase